MPRPRRSSSCRGRLDRAPAAGALGGEDLGVEAGGVDVGVDLGRGPGAAGRRRAATVAARSSAKRHTAAVDAGEAPGELARRAACSVGEVDVAVVGAADQLERRLAAGRDRVGHLVDRAVEACRCARATRRCPCPGSGAAGGCGCRRRARRRGRPGQLVGELDAGGRGADDEHAAVGQLRRVAVGRRRDLGDGRRRGGGAWPGRPAGRTSRWRSRRWRPASARVGRDDREAVAVGARRADDGAVARPPARRTTSA